jgi:hypothetical protein
MRAAIAGALLLAVALVSTGGCNGEQAASGDAQTDEPGNDSALAQTPIPDCYAESGIGIDPPAPSRALFALVDQTTGLDDRLRDKVRGSFVGLMGPGTQFTVSTFSAFSRGHYTTIVETGTLQAQVAEDRRPSLPVRRLEALDACLDRQREIAGAHARAALAGAMSAEASTFTNSEIMASLSQLSEAVRAAPGRDKMVLLVSDLLEHSSITSFYQNRAIRPVDAAAEMAKAESQDLFGDFNGAAIVVVGAGLLAPESTRGATRDTGSLGALRRFWEQWLERSNGRLVAYGQPDLVAPVQWSSAQPPPG